MRLLTAISFCLLATSICSSAGATPVIVQPSQKSAVEKVADAHGITEYNWSSAVAPSVKPAAGSSNDLSIDECFDHATRAKVYIQTFSAQPPLEPSAIFKDVRLQACIGEAQFNHAHQTALTTTTR